MNETKLVTNFKSYLSMADDEFEGTDISEDLPELKPKRLRGEVIIAEAPKTLLFAPMSENRVGLSGTLTVTNFKLSFVTQKKNEEEQLCQQSLLLGEQEVCLLAVDSVYHIVDKKRRLLTGQQKVPEKIKEIVIICKNFRVLTFSFKFSPVQSGMKIVKSLLHHIVPTRHILLFAYEYKEPYYVSSNSLVRNFRDHIDWERELERTNSNRQKWRISTANEMFQMSPILPRFLVIPADLYDHQLSEASRHFRSGFIPIWVWTDKNGAALVRMSDLLSSIVDRTQENIMLENVRKCHPNMKQPAVLDLTKDLPSLRDVFVSYIRLRDLCTPDNMRTFWFQDRHFYALLDTSKWLTWVSACLKKVSEAVNLIHDEGNTVVLQEGDGCDMCCLISSLIQLVLDPHWRTVIGFQTLIQKEWVALGHPFDKRLGHILSKTGNERAPLLLMFLDCVWQLLQQFPSAFQFTETYLTTVWDSAHISVFDTFLFDSERRRVFATEEKANPVTLRSVWDWGEQFSEKDIALFYNPLFDERFNDILKIEFRVAFLDIWTLCYFRWLPQLEIINGGKPQVYLYTRAITAEIDRLQQLLLNGAEANENGGDKVNNLVSLQCKVNSFFPFSQNDLNINDINGIFTLNSSMIAGDILTIDTQSILNAPDY